jgi:GntR family transcriptional repressor for pyruvate dehydrogenase complex
MDAVKRSLGNLAMFDKEQHWEDLVQVRELFEPGIARLAALNAKPEDILAMTEAVETMENSLENPDSYIAADNKFHNALASATGNDLISSLLDPIIELLIEQRRFVFNSKHGGPRAGQVFHKKILKTVKQRDGDAAQQAMMEHLKQVSRDTKQE